MKFIARILALIGMQTAASAAQGPAGAQPPFEYQLWSADHVVLTAVAHSGAGADYRLQRVLKGNAGTLQFRETRVLDVNDAAWQLLGPRAVTGDSALLLLRGPNATAPVHSAFERYVLDTNSRFTHAPGDASVRRTMTVSDVERMLRAPPFDTRECGRVTVRDEYVLCTEILHGGTRSEGRVGRLYRHGVEMKAARKGQRIDTEPTGGGLQFIFLGDERPHLWSVSGWDLESHPR